MEYGHIMSELWRDPIEVGKFISLQHIVEKEGPEAKDVENRHARSEKDSCKYEGHTVCHLVIEWINWASMEIDESKISLRFTLVVLACILWQCSPCQPSK